METIAVNREWAERLLELADKLEEHGFPYISTDVSQLIGFAQSIKYQL